MPFLMEKYGKIKHLRNELAKRSFKPCGGYQDKSLNKLISFSGHPSRKIILSPGDESAVNRRWWLRNFNKFIPLIDSRTKELSYSRVSKIVETVSVSLWVRSDKVAFLFSRRDGLSMYKVFSISDIVRYSNPRPNPHEGAPRPYPFFPLLLDGLSEHCL